MTKLVWERKHFTKAQIQTFPDEDLWAIVRSTKPIGGDGQTCNELTWAKEELRKRGHAVT